MSLARRTLQVVALVCTLVVGAASMAVIVTQTTWFKEWLRGFIVKQAEDYVNGRLSIGRLDGNLFFGVDLEDVDVTMNGETVVDIKDVGLDYNAFSFLSGGIVLDDIRLTQPVFRLEKDGDGWNLTRLIKARTPDPDEPKTRRPLEIGEIGISDGTLYVEDGAVGTSGVDVPSRIERLDASIGVATDEGELTVEIGHVSLRSHLPAIGINALSGVIRRRENSIVLENVSLRSEETSLRVDGSIGNIEDGGRSVDLRVSSDKFDVEEIARVVPALRGYPLQPAFELTARGPLDRLSVDINAREASLGQVAGDLTVDATAPTRTVAGTLSMANLNVAPIFRRPNLKSDITGQARIDMLLPESGTPIRGTYTVKAQRVQIVGYDARNVDASGRIDGRVIQVSGSADAYGGHATTNGVVTVGSPVSLDLQGRAEGVDLRNMPPVLNAPGVPSDLQFTYTLKGRGGVYSSDVVMDASTLAGASISSGTVGQISFGSGRAPTYAAQGEVRNLDVEQIGRGFGITAIATDKYRGRINANYHVDGSGGGRYPLTIDATGTAVDSEMFGASFPRMDFTTNIGGGDIHVKARGEFSNLDLSVVTGNERAASTLTGSVDVDTTIRGYASGVTVDSVDAAGRVNLGESKIADLDIDTAAIEGTYTNRQGHLTQFTVSGADLKIDAKGDIALNDTGASNLTAHVESPALERIGEILGRPLKGAVVADATVTGNASELKATGMLNGSNIGYGNSEALSLASEFTVTLPELTPQDAAIQAKSTATFVEVAGQMVRELTADTTYSNSKLDFNAVAQEGVRELAAEGSAVFHPDHQEVHLFNVALRTEQIAWQTAPGSQPTIRYGNNRIGVEGLELVSGDQRVEADGVLGSPDDTLRVRASNVDVAQLDQLLLADQRVAGRLNATATITGPAREPRAEGEFTLSQGAFQQFMFESLTGKVDYRGLGMTIDVRLQQTPEAWLTATGYAPVSLFRRNPPGVGGHELPEAGESIDLTIASSRVDLGVIQGFTSYVTNVTGALQANVRVTGTGTDPHFDGSIDIRGGTFQVPELGTAYTGLDTRIGLENDAVNVSEMRIVDEHNNAMTVGGTIALHERSVGAVDVKIQSEDFEVIDNVFADLKLDSDVRVTGELRKPRVEGFVEVETGSIDVARLIDQFTTDPYATEPVAFDAADPAVASESASSSESGVPSGGEVSPEPLPSAPSQPAQASTAVGILDALDLSLGVAVPSNLVLRGNDLRGGDSPVDFGDINATVGGAIQVRKSPGQSFRVIGEVNTVRGSYTFQGRRFDILRDGRIRFAGTEEIDPQLDVRARRIISGVETFVRVQGTMRQPELTFSSNPPLDQADILSLIVFNMPINELGEGQQASLAERAGTLAGGYLVSGLTRSLADALEIDELEIQAQGEQGMGPTLSIGEQVGERLFFRIRQGFGAEQATEFILEYQIADYLRLQGALAETAGGTQRTTFRRIERAGLDLIFFFSY
jgi:autotransporter translocation and assembly factor TamB